MCLVYIILSLSLSLSLTLFSHRYVPSCMSTRTVSLSWRRMVGRFLSTRSCWERAQNSLNLVVVVCQIVAAQGERRKVERSRVAGNPKRRIVMTTVRQWVESEWRNRCPYNSYQEHRSEFTPSKYIICITRGWNTMYIWPILFCIYVHTLHHPPTTNVLFMLWLVYHLAMHNTIWKNGESVVF